jgi:hypothetical protein
MPAPDPNATLHLPPTRVTEPGPTVASPQSTIRYQPGMMPLKPPGFAASNAGGSDTSRRSALPWLLGIAIVIGVSGVLIALILTLGRREPNQKTTQTSMPTTSPTQSAEVTAQSDEGQQLATTTTVPATKSPERPPKKATEEATPGSTTVTRATPQQTSSESRPKPMFGPVMDNTSFNGTRITYYPRPSFGMCRADCGNNPNCKGFTWIRPGAYNPGDSAMCYLMSAVSGRVTHACCMSAVKN